MENSEFKVIVTGVTGMVGEGVLHECLLSPEVSEVLVITRKATGQAPHPKLKELILPDFMQANELETQVKGYHACFFCLGVSSLGMKEEEYTKKTYDLTLGFAKALVTNNPDLRFLYISGSGSDQTEKGPLMWARVKGRTENDLGKLGFKDSFGIRPGIILPTKGLKNTLQFYHYTTWIHPLIRKFFPSMVSTMNELGLAMIHIGKYGFEKKRVEVRDICQIAKSSIG